MITYLTGDATQPVGDGNKIIAHVCNDVGGWGRGFVVALSKRWAPPEEQYRSWAKGLLVAFPAFSLGNVAFVPIEPAIMVANMIAQHDTKWMNGKPPIRYEALKECLSKVSDVAIDFQSSVHMPRIGCGLAGGDWSIVEKLINETLTNVKTYVYDLPVPVQT